MASSLPHGMSWVLPSQGCFRDALSFKYGWQSPSVCVCGKLFNVRRLCIERRVSKHNEICDFMAKLRTEVCHNVCVEPPLQHRTVEAG